MSKLHVLDIIDPGSPSKPATCVLHASTPTGNNSAGILWKDAMIALGITGHASALPVKSGPGGITTQENTNLVQGDLVEIVQVMDTEPTSRLAADADLVILQGMIRLKAQADRVGFTVA